MEVLLSEGLTDAIYSQFMIVAERARTAKDAADKGLAVDQSPPSLADLKALDAVYTKCALMAVVAPAIEPIASSTSITLSDLSFTDKQTIFTAVTGGVKRFLKE